MCVCVCVLWSLIYAKLPSSLVHYTQHNRSRKCCSQPNAIKKPSAKNDRAERHRVKQKSVEKGAPKCKQDKSDNLNKVEQQQTQKHEAKKKRKWKKSNEQNTTLVALAIYV